MGFQVLSSVLGDWNGYELDDTIYVPAGAEPCLDSKIQVLSFEPTRSASFEGQIYFLGIEQLRDVVVGLEQQLGRRTSLEERLKAAIYYANNDAFINPHQM